MLSQYIICRRNFDESGFGYFQSPCCSEQLERLTVSFLNYTRPFLRAKKNRSDITVRKFQNLYFVCSIQFKGSVKCISFGSLTSMYTLPNVEKGSSLHVTNQCPLFVFDVTNLAIILILVLMFSHVDSKAYFRYFVKSVLYSLLLTVHESCLCCKQIFTTAD